MAHQRSPIDRFMEKVDFDMDGCWLWTACRDVGGYGIFQFASKKTVKAHRFSYEQFVAPIPDGLVLDHVCRVRHCVNPAHLNPCTSGENIHAPGSLAPAAANALKTHCPVGHPYDDINTYVQPNGGRACRICKRDSGRRHDRRRRER